MNKWIILALYHLLICTCSALENCSSIENSVGPQCKWDLHGECHGPTCTICQPLNICKNEETKQTCSSSATADCKNGVGKCKGSGISYYIIYSEGCPVLACGGDEGIECSTAYSGGGILAIEGLNVPVHLRQTISNYLVSDLERVFLSKRELIRGVIGINVMYTKPSTETTMVTWGFRKGEIAEDSLYEVQAVLDSVFLRKVLALDGLRSLALRNNLGTDVRVNYEESTKPQIFISSTESSSSIVPVIVGGILGGTAVVAILLIAVLYYKHTHQGNSAITRPSGGNALSDIRTGFSDIRGPSKEEEVTRNANRMSRKNRRKQEDNRDKLGQTPQQACEVDDTQCVEMGSDAIDIKNDTTIVITD